MEQGYTKADNRNLPKVDIFMVGSFFATNSDFCSAEFRNVKTLVSARQSYGDDAIGYVQLHREADMCTIKCKVCPEHKVRSKSYAATMVVNEKEAKIISVQCHDCAASTGGCKHAVAFLLWVHRRSEEPSCTEIQCYWKKSKLAQVGTSVKYITVKDLSAGKRPRLAQKIPPHNNMLTQFLRAAANRNVTNCELLKYTSSSSIKEHEKLSLHYLIIEHCNNSDCDVFLDTIAKYFTETNIQMIEENTRSQYKNKLWHELRYGRVTASKAYEVIKCHTVGGSLTAMIMGAKTPDTKAMRRGRHLESQVKMIVEKTLGKKVKECGLFISSKYPFIAGSPDGIFDKKFCIEIKCPTNEKSYQNYIKDNKVTEKCMAQIQIQMFVTNLRYCYFCVADSNFEKSNNVEMLLVNYDENLVKLYISCISEFWKKEIFPILYE
ncbi:uncharacterized protein LOC132902276, partial [Amyelois transitella]|uniref:uncharacterized protein LOC132902276 n=1 Tax=Amyelois transitella TaxID=680683 RepID=UPI00298F82FD